MRRLAGTVLVIALASAGCIGSRSSSTSNGRSDDLGLIPLKTDLTCSPDGGDYDDPAAACRALTDVVAKLDAPGRALCMCPLMPRPADKAVGIYRGKRRTITLDGCSLCGLQGIGADIALLMPGAGVSRRPTS
jgi:hypothetical protein